MNREVSLYLYMVNFISPDVHFDMTDFLLDLIYQTDIVGEITEANFHTQ